MSERETTSAAAQPRRPSLPAARLLLAAAVVVALVLVGREAGQAVLRFAAWVDGLGGWAPIVYVLGYVVATVAFLPGSLLTLGAGAVFGLVQGTLLVLVGATLGAAAAFLVSRYAARGLVERRLAGNRRFAAIDRAIGADGRRIVFLLRLSPAIPFNLLNYALGLTRVRFGDFVLASAGMVPGTLLYVYYGKVAGDVARLAGGAPTQQRGAGYYVVLALGLAATVLAAALVTRTARRALEEVTGDDRDAR